MIALHVLSVALNIYVLSVISCDTDHQLQRVMIINTVHQVHKNVIYVCITGKASVDNTEWVAMGCHSNLNDWKLPVCSKANKMNFPVKPECLNFTLLEEAVIFPRILANLRTPQRWTIIYSLQGCLCTS